MGDNLKLPHFSTHPLLHFNFTFALNLRFRPHRNLEILLILSKAVSKLRIAPK